MLRYYFRMTAVQMLQPQALSLSQRERAELVSILLESLPDGFDDDIEAEQFCVIRKRIDEIKSGRVKPVSGEEVFRRIEESLVARRSE